MKSIKDSLVFKLTVGTALVMIILFTVLITSNIYSLNVVKNNTVISAENAVKIYINDMDNSLNNAIMDLNEIITNADDISNLTSTNESIQYFAANRLKDVLSSRINSNKNTDVYIVYNSVSKLFLSANSSKVTATEKLDISNYVDSSLSNKKVNFGALWSPVEINNTVYFLKMYHFSDNSIVALIKADTLMSFINATALKTEEQYVLTDTHGKPLTKVAYEEFSDVPYPLSNDKTAVNILNNKYMLITTALGKCDARLSVIIKEKNILLGLNFIQVIIAFLAIASLIIMPYIIYYLNKEIIKPINKLIEGTRQVEQGNLEYQVKIHSNSKEFEKLTRSFNSMTKEIKTLKISSYEEKIEVQKSELKYLQMQIRPHFFLNAITTIHSMTYKNKNEEIRAFIDALSKHLRYMFRGGLVKVTIKEEIEHVKNYFSMQEIKFPNSVFYFFDVDKTIEEEVIPQFLIHTFVENSFKHAMTLEETLSIFIKFQLGKFKEKDAIYITIEDSGEGFPQAIIDKVNNVGVDESSDGHKIGISNIKRTLTLLYGKENLLKISNVEAMGGRIEIIIPIEKGDSIETNYSR